MIRGRKNRPKTTTTRPTNPRPPKMRTFFIAPAASARLEARRVSLDPGFALGLIPVGSGGVPCFVLVVQIIDALPCELLAQVDGDHSPRAVDHPANVCLGSYLDSHQAPFRRVERGNLREEKGARQ